jgi:hypothetical protein
VAVGITTHGLRKPDNKELARNGENDISYNAQKTDDLITATLAVQSNLAARLGRAEANIQAGNGNGPGLSEDPLNPGFFFMADDSPLTEDPENPGFYTF